MPCIVNLVLSNPKTLSLLLVILLLAGVLGLRTEHQIDAKAQLTVQTSRNGLMPVFEADEAASLEQAGSEKNVLELAEESASRHDVLEDIRLADGAGMKCLLPYEGMHEAKACVA